jgi:hypothetical protein
MTVATNNQPGIDAELNQITSVVNTSIQVIDRTMGWRGGMPGFAIAYSATRFMTERDFELTGLDRE